MAKLKVFDDYGCIATKNNSKADKQVDRLFVYTEDRLHRLLRKLMRNGVSLIEAERMILLCSGSMAQMIKNRDFTKAEKARQDVERAAARKMKGSSTSSPASSPATSLPEESAKG